MRSPSTRMGIDKGHGESIRNDKRPAAGGTNWRSPFQTGASEFHFFGTAW